MILYVDKQSHGDAVCGYKILSMEYECFTERNGRTIQGLAFDPATELCFFTDTNEKSINWFSLKSETTNTVIVNTVIKIDNGIPTDIAVDSCRGYVTTRIFHFLTDFKKRRRFSIWTVVFLCLLPHISGIYRPVR